jgi:hypothetical protein
MKLVKFLSQKEEEERMKVHSPGVAGREVDKLSKSKEEEERMKEHSQRVAGHEVGRIFKSKGGRRKNEGTILRGGWP